jgi:hypothetical protein
MPIDQRRRRMPAGLRKQRLLISTVDYSICFPSSPKTTAPSPPLPSDVLTRIEGSQTPHHLNFQ